MTTPIYERFSWLAPEAFKTEDVGKNKIRIKGIALRSESVSRNMRHYVDEELVKSARTLAGKPININHDDTRIVGNVEWAEYEDGLLEYYGIVSKQPYVELIRKHDATVKGVSVQAKYMHNKCPKCGNKFFTAEDFTKHMTEVEHIHNFKWEPRGIIHDALALVIDPEIPGFPSTTLEAMETSKGFSQLWETLTHDIEERINMEKEKPKLEGAVITAPKHIAIGSAGPNPTIVAEKVAETPTATPLHASPLNESPRETATSPPINEKEESEIAKELEAISQQISKLEQKLYPVKAESPMSALPQEERIRIQTELSVLRAKQDGLRQALTSKTMTAALTEFKDITFTPLTLGEPCSAKLQSCVDQMIAKGEPEDKAWRVCRANIGETTDKLQLTTHEPPSFEQLRKTGLSEEASAQRIKETRIHNENLTTVQDYITLLESNQALLHKNDTTLLSGLEEIRATLTKADVERQRNTKSIIEQQNQDRKDFIKSDNDLFENIKTLDSKTETAVKEHLTHHPQDDTTWKEHVDNHPQDNLEWQKDVASLKETVQALPKDDLTWKEAIASLPKDDLAWKEHLDKHPQDDLTWKEHLEKHPQDDTTWREQLPTFATKEALTQAITNIDTKLKEYDTIKQAIEKADKTVTETANRDAELRQQLEETKKQLKETQDKLQETAKIAEKAKTLAENTDDKIKGKFKGQQAQQKAKTDVPLLHDPMKGG